MRRSLVLAAVPSVALLALAGAPATSSAAVITPSAACYSSLASKPPIYEPMTGTLAGGTPGARFDLVVGTAATAAFTGTFDAAGNGGYLVGVYGALSTRPSAGRTLGLTVREYTPGVVEPTVTGTTTVKTSTFGAAVAETPKDPLDARTARASSPFFAGRQVYMNVVRGTRSTKVLKRVSLGTGNACGYVRRKAVAFPRTYRTGTYSFVFSTTRKVDRRQTYVVSLPVRR